ncbi:MAG: 16S rRNA (cytidine(1402)-2'-O)-methyltransferase [Gammaproteobacteria bacterium]|nr:16S rRNA (cytidine(1402)-2'-O)-methyltransferase [Gammaproteobacteria bacterium]
MSGTLYVVATPIGNLQDLTPRAREALASVDLIAAEDTRHTGRLLMTIRAKPALLALHDHNEERAAQEVIAALQSGNDVALVSDAGTPLVSDPGYRLVREAHGADIRVVPLPGASAVTAALSVAGLPTDRFCFEGFAPSKRSARRQWLVDLAGEARTIVIYESVHRIADCLADLVDILGAERRAFIGRELTKLHEQCVCASLGELRAMVDDGRIVAKGEFVLVIEGGEREVGVAADTDRILRLLSASLSARDTARIASELTGKKKNALYERVLEIRNELDS